MQNCRHNHHTTFAANLYKSRKRDLRKAISLLRALHYCSKIIKENYFSMINPTSTLFELKVFHYYSI